MTTHADENGPFKEFEFGQWISDEFKQVRAKAGRRWEARREIRRENIKRQARRVAKVPLVAMRDLLDTAIETLEKKSPPQV